MLMQRSDPDEDERGAALLGVLLVCVLLAAIASEVALQRRGVARDLRLRTDAAQAEAAAESLLRVAHRSLGGPSGPACDPADREARTLAVVQQVRAALGVRGAALGVAAVPSQALLDVNFASSEELATILRAEGLSPASVEAAVRALSAYRRTDGLGPVRAEATGLVRRTAWSRSAGAFDDPDELGRVPDLPPEALSSLLPVATVHGRGRCGLGATSAFVVTATADINGARAVRRSVVTLGPGPDDVDVHSLRVAEDGFSDGAP